MPLTDARTLPDASRIEADIVIIGGGMAGLAIAYEFVGTATRVVVLESGGPDPDTEIQGLYDGPGVMSGPGNPDLPIDTYLRQSRVRALGGSGHVGGGKCGPLDAVDFAERDIGLAVLVGIGGDKFGFIVETDTAASLNLHEKQHHRVVYPCDLEPLPGQRTIVNLFAGEIRFLVFQSRWRGIKRVDEIALFFQAAI